MITVTIKNPNHLKNALSKEKQHGIDAGRSAISKESYRLYTVLRKEMKEGSPGGVSWHQLGWMSMSQKETTPLAKMRFMMRYGVMKRGKTWWAEVGYIPHLMTVKRLFPKGGKISWGKILEHQQAGISVKVTDKMRRKFLSKALGSQGKWQGGGRSGGKVFVKTKTRKGTWTRAGRSGGRVFTQSVKKVSPYFIRRDAIFKIPSRPIFDPFWRRHKSKAMDNIRRNFGRIMGSEKRRMLNQA